MVGTRAPGWSKFRNLKTRKMLFFEGCPVGYPPELAGGQGLDQGLWLQFHLLGLLFQRVARGGGRPPQGRSKFRNLRRIFDLAAGEDKTASSGATWAAKPQGATTTNANAPNPCIPAHARDRNQVKTVLSELSLDANTKCPSLHPCTCTRPQPGENRGE